MQEVEGETEACLDDEIQEVPADGEYSRDCRRPSVTFVKMAWRLCKRCGDLIFGSPTCWYCNPCLDSMSNQPKEMKETA